MSRQSPLSEPPPRRRRAHHKSRQGCSHCKTRHIKCDENRPQCANCVMSDRRCSFPESCHRPTRGNTSTTRQATAKASHVALQTHEDGAHFTAIHLACLHHAEAHMETYMALHGSARPIIDSAINHAATAPFLLDQVLALSALHLSTQNPSKQSLYRHQATELQTRALGLFNQAREEISHANGIPMFLFASLLGIHVLKETLSSHGNSLTAFIDAFINYVHLHRGVRTVITNASWAHILQSDLKPLLSLLSFSDDIEKQTPGTETVTLSKFLGSYDAGPESINACQSALNHMQWALDICHRNPSREDLGIHATMAWPLLVPQEYIEALYQHRPEAFAVLAFYAATLHRYREFWVFGESGSSLLQLISSNLGSFWHDNLGLSVHVLLEA